MDIIITMGGLGSRFKKAGYECPKYMIEVRGKTLFEWSLDSLREFWNEKFIFIVRKEDSAYNFICDKCKALGINSTKIIEIDYLTKGQAETAYLAKDFWNKENPILIYNIDTYIEPYNLLTDKINGEGVIPCFNADGDHWSFVRVKDGSDEAIEVREKSRISDNCSIGAYYFSSGKLYEDVYKEYYLNHNNFEKGEAYIAPMYNFMIENGYKVCMQNIEVQYVHVLGTPEEVQVFQHENIK